MPEKPKFIPYRNALKIKARQLRANMTEPERRLWFQFLRDFPHPVLRQKPIAEFIVDFFCARLRLVIELDGDSHYTENAVDYDAARTNFLEQRGLRVLRFTNREVMENFDAVCERIWQELGATTPRRRGAANPPALRSTPFDKGFKSPAYIEERKSPGPSGHPL